MWVKDKTGVCVRVGGAQEESQEPSCMVGVSGRFLCDMQVEARPQRSSDATQTPQRNLLSITSIKNDLTKRRKKSIQKKPLAIALT